MSANRKAQKAARKHRVANKKAAKERRAKEKRASHAKVAGATKPKPGAPKNTKPKGTKPKAAAPKAPASNGAASKGVATRGATTAAAPATKPRSSRGIVPAKRAPDAPRPVPVTTGPLIGAHVSAAGGTPETPLRAADIGARCFQLFTKQGNRWADRVVTAEEAAAFRVALQEFPSAAVVAHDSYLINLASPDPELRGRSIQSFIGEMERAEALGLLGVVSHPGNFMDEREAGLARNADGIAEALERAPGTTKLFLETTAGSGTALGVTFEEIAAIIERLPATVRGRVGVCLDTCHVYSAGYDLVKDYDGVWARFDDVIGRERLGVLHLNDSKTPFASRKDRHEQLGDGSLGAEPFRRIMTDARLANIPKLLETPKGDDLVTFDRRALAKLRAWAAGA
jgi:deoxyribonuclease-4